MNEHEIFATAIKLTGDARDVFLAAACGQDAMLRKQVDGLLSAHDESGGLLPREADRRIQDQGLESTQLAAHQTASGTMVGGRYKLLEAIGEGGMGSVWLAEQREPVRRKVALKLIKAGMDSRSVLARFDAERQALALMDHPNIAKVFDGGMTESGRPFFVMEYVKGVPLTEYCDQARLSLKERLNLFMPVCQAVQHAHQKGIIHRDLKPSNILICLYDGKPMPKVIDFGLAKAMHQSLTDQSLHTAIGMMVGTPLYMSPEQAEHNNLDVDTRTDIYSLGVILYELLTGSTPLEKQQLKAAAFNEILRLIKEVEPPKPSTRMSGSASLPSVAAQRNIDPRQLSKSLTGDLDWIVMKALDKERSRRYETANGLARDVERYLNDEAIEACPPSNAYRIRKFIRRNRPMVTSVSAVAAALVIGMIAFAWQAKVANDQRQLAEKARESESEQRKLANEERDRAVQAQRAEAEQRKLADNARAEAENQKIKALEKEAEAKKQASIADAVVRFQTDMLAAVDPTNLPMDPVTNEPLKDTVTVLQALQAAVKILDEGSLKDQPLVEAYVRQAIGRTLRSLGRYVDAEPNLQKSLALIRAEFPVSEVSIATAQCDLGVLLMEQERFTEAELLLREALAIRREALPVGHEDIANSLNNLASLLVSQGKLDEAEPLFRESLEINRAALPARHEEIASNLINLAFLLRAKKKLTEVEPLFREALAIQRKSLPAGHPEIGRTLHNIAAELRRQNRLAEAETLYREALEISRTSLPEGHRQIGYTLNALASLLEQQNKIEEAESLFRETLANRRAAFPAGHPQIGQILNQLGALLLNRQNKIAEAEPLLRESLEIARKGRPEGHPEIGMALSILASLLQEQNKLAEAEPLYRESLAIHRAIGPAANNEIVNILSNLGQLLQQQDKFAEAEEIQRELLQIYRLTLPKDSPELSGQLTTFSRTLLRLKAWEEAELLLRESLSIREKFQPNSWSTFNTQSLLGAALLGQKKFAEAEPLLLKGYAGLKKRKPVIPPQGLIRIPESLERLIELYNRWHAAEPDKGFETKAAEWQTKLEEHM